MKKFRLNYYRLVEMFIRKVIVLLVFVFVLVSMFVFVLVKYNKIKLYNLIERIKIVIINCKYFYFRYNEI